MNKEAMVHAWQLLQIYYTSLLTALTFPISQSRGRDLRHYSLARSGALSQSLGGASHSAISQASKTDMLASSEPCDNFRHRLSHDCIKKCVRKWLSFREFCINLSKLLLSFLQGNYAGFRSPHTSTELLTLII